MIKNMFICVWMSLTVIWAAMITSLILDGFYMKAFASAIIITMFVVIVKLCYHSNELSERIGNLKQKLTELEANIENLKSV